jgi:D-lactate dehydrogenase (cytochrome)
MAEPTLDPESKMDVLSAPDRNLADALIGIMGRAHVLEDAADRDYYAADLFFQGPPALLVVQPVSRNEVVQAVKACYAAGAAIVPRGGGLSYTGGYVPTGPRAVIFDTRRLNRVVAVEADDLYVTVEAGCT